MVAGQRIRIRLQAFDYNLLDGAAREIASTIRRTGAEIFGPVPLPTNIERYIVNKSPHVYKTSREQFEVRKHKRLIIIDYSTPQTVTALMKVDLAYGVDVEIKLMGNQ